MFLLWMRIERAHDRPLCEAIRNGHGYPRRVTGPHLVGPGLQVGITVRDSCVHDSWSRVYYRPRTPTRSWPDFPLVCKSSGAVLRGREVESSTVTERVEMKAPSEPSIRYRTLPQVGARRATICARNQRSLSRRIFRGEHEQVHSMQQERTFTFMWGVQSLVTAPPGPTLEQVTRGFVG